MPDTGKPAVFHWPVRVYFEDTDAGGVVYHANYLRFMERARTEWLRAIGFEQDYLRTHFGIQFVVTAVNVHYRRAVRFNAQLEVDVRVTELGRVSLTFEQHILEGEQIICEGDIRVACVDVVSFKPRSLPPEIVAELKR